MKKETKQILQYALMGVAFVITFLLNGGTTGAITGFKTGVAIGAIIFLTTSLIPERE